MYLRDTLRLPVKGLRPSAHPFLTNLLALSLRSLGLHRRLRSHRRLRNRRESRLAQAGTQMTDEISLNSRHSFLQESPPSSLRYKYPYRLPANTTSGSKGWPLTTHMAVFGATGSDKLSQVFPVSFERITVPVRPGVVSPIVNG